MTKVVLEAAADTGLFTATAVEFFSGGESFSVPVKKEVISSAGESLSNLDSLPAGQLTR